MAGNMPPSTRSQASTQSDRRLRKRPRTTTSTTINPVAKAPSDIGVVDLTEEQEDMIIRTSQSDGCEGKKRWRADFDKLKTTWKTGEIEGYGGLIASIQSESR